MRQPIRILVTGAGAPGTGGTVWALRTGAESDGLRAVFFGTDMQDSVPLAFLFETFASCPPASQADVYMEAIHMLAEREKVDLIVPQTTPEVLLLSQHRADLDVPVLVAEHASVSRANNKIRLAQHFAMHERPHPQFFVTTNRDEVLKAVSELGYPHRPVVAKLPDSSGGRGVRIVDSMHLTWDRFSAEKPDSMRISLDDLLNALSGAPLWPELMISEFVDGKEYSVDVYSGPHGGVAVPRERLSIRSGITFKSRVCRNTQLEELSLWAAESLSLCGVSGFQFMLGADEPKVIECNPRVQGTMVASITSGNNVIWMAARDALQLEVGARSIATEWKSATSDRYWGIVLSDGSDRIVI